MDPNALLAHEARMFHGADVKLVGHSDTAGVQTLVYDVRTTRQLQRRVAVFYPGAEHSVWSGIAEASCM